MDTVLLYEIRDLIQHVWNFTCSDYAFMLQVRHLIDTGESREMRIEIENVINSSTPKLARNGLYLLLFIKRFKDPPLMCLLISVGFLF